LVTVPSSDELIQVAMSQNIHTATVFIYSWALMHTLL